MITVSTKIPRLSLRGQKIIVQITKMKIVITTLTVIPVFVPKPPLKVNNIVLIIIFIIIEVLDKLMMFLLILIEL